MVIEKNSWKKMKIHQISISISNFQIFYSEHSIEGESKVTVSNNDIDKVLVLTVLGPSKPPSHSL